MKRRTFCSGAAATGGFAALTLTVGRAAAATPRHVVSLASVQQAVATRFPLRLDVAGLFHLDLQTPQLQLLPEQNRVRSEIGIQAAGEALRHRYNGIFDLDFKLRYEAIDQTVRAHLPRVHALRLVGLPPRPAEILGAFGPGLAQEALQGLVLHRLEPRDLALPDAMGLEPDAITITAQGLMIEFKPRSASRRPPP